MIDEERLIINEDRLGFFMINKSFIDDSRRRGGLGYILYKMKFIPKHVEYDFKNDCYKFVGYSPKFELVNISFPVPEYIIQAEVDAADNMVTGQTVVRLKDVHVMLKKDNMTDHYNEDKKETTH